MFYYAYAQETFPIIGHPIAFPMISLCDIPVSEIAEFMEKYDGYSIGLTRDWGVKKGFNPVWYCEDDSLIEKELVKDFTKVLTAKHQNYKWETASLVALNVFSYTKKVQGPLKRQGYSSYRFYDEREFRIVYPFNDCLKNGFELALIGDAEYDDYKANHKGTKFLQGKKSKYGKRISWSDIKYIIVPLMSEVEEFKQYLKELKCTNNDIMIFHYNQIRHDFLGLSHFKREEEDWQNEKIQDIPLTEEQMLLFAKGYEPDFNCRYAPYMFEGWFYITRSGEKLKKLKYVKGTDGYYHITEHYTTEKEKGRNLLMEIIVQGYFEPRIFDDRLRELFNAMPPEL
jgi:hypothetical protein